MRAKRTSAGDFEVVSTISILLRGARDPGGLAGLSGAFRVRDVRRIVARIYSLWMTVDGASQVWGRGGRPGHAKVLDIALRRWAQIVA